MLVAYFVALFVAEYRQSCRVLWIFSRFLWTRRSVQCYSKVVSMIHVIYVVLSESYTVMSVDWSRLYALSCGEVGAQLCRFAQWSWVTNTIRLQCDPSTSFTQRRSLWKALTRHNI